MSEKLKSMTKVELQEDKAKDGSLVAVHPLDAYMNEMELGEGRSRKVSSCTSQATVLGLKEGQRTEVNTAVNNTENQLLIETA